MKVWIPFTAAADDTNTVSLTATSSNDLTKTKTDSGKIIVKPSLVSVDGGVGVTPIRSELAITGSNPFVRDTEVRLSLPRSQTGSLRVYNLEGRVVRAYRTGAVIELRKWVLRNKALASALLVAFVLLVIGLLTNRSLYLTAVEQGAVANRQAYRAAKLRRSRQSWSKPQKPAMSRSGPQG